MALYRIWLILFTFYSALSAEPVITAVFGSESCPWSQQLRREVWESPTFRAMVASSEISLKEEARVVSETPIFILSDRGEEIGRVGFLLITAEKYASLFKEMVAIDAMTQTVDHLAPSQLLHLYRKCQLLNMERCQAKILERGVEIDPGTDFLIESYARVAKAHPRKAQKIKSEIRRRSPETAAVEWQLALIAFQAKNEQGVSPQEAARPLEKYLRRYGESDRDTLWRCHLILSEYFAEKNLPQEALKHRQRVMELAPQELKGLMLDE